MKSSSKTVQPRKPSLMREFLWVVYKWSLVGLCMYFCYRMLHINSGIYSGELLACILITWCFILIIKYHATLKKKAEQPDFHDNLSVLPDFITWVFYGGLYIYFERYRFRKMSRPCNDCFSCQVCYCFYF